MIIRPCHISDLVALYRVCLLTGNAGSDASQLYRDPHLLGAFYAAPYAVLEPGLCSVVLQGAAVLGYVLGTADSVAFHRLCEQAWFPPLRLRYPYPSEDDLTPDANLARAIHQGIQYPAAWVNDYPAHLHINLLPAAQGQGIGKQLMRRFLRQLREQQVPGVHLGVAANNTAAVAFYRSLGFDVLQDLQHSYILGMTLE